MASIGEVNYNVDEIAFLESMFGGTVSAAVIASVLESCDGNVHLAADAIMNFSDEMSTPAQQIAQGIDVRPVQLTSVLNVDAPAFEFRHPQTTTQQTSLITVNQPSVNLQVCITETHDLPTILQPPTNTNESPLTTTSQNSSTIPNLDTSKTVNQNLPIAKRQSPTYLKQQLPTSAMHQLSTTARQQPSASVRQPLSKILNQQPLNTGPLSTAESSTVSFSDAFRNSGAIPKKPPDSKPQKSRNTIKNVWHDKVGKFLHYHNQGTRTLIIMRGAPGSGKSYLAKHLINYTIGPSMQNYSKHIFSADNFFMRRGVYQYNRDSLQEAHATNQRKVCEATNRGVSPVIVDNTNTELWEMEPYIRDGVRNGYMIEFVEPNTPWARNPSHLEKKNIHGVPRDRIRRMLDRYETGITLGSVLKTLKLKYASNRLPPVQRDIPPISPPQSLRESPKVVNIEKVESDKDVIVNASNVELAHQDQCDFTCEQNSETVNHIAETGSSPDAMLDDEHDIKLQKIIEAQLKIEQLQKVAFRESPKEVNVEKVESDKDEVLNASNVKLARQDQCDSTCEQNSVTVNHIAEKGNSPDAMLDDEYDIKLQKIIEAQLKIEQFEKVEQEWDNGESWDTTNGINNHSIQNSVGGFGSIDSAPKPPREAANKDNEKLIQPSAICDDDWTKFMPPWEGTPVANLCEVEVPVQVETRSIGTSFELDDMNEHMYTVLYAITRDINENTPVRNRSRIPKTIVLDKSTATHDNDFLSKKPVCKNKEGHFRELRRMFKTVARQSLRDIFESCNCDVNWAVNLVLDSYPESQENVNNDVIMSDEEDEEPVEECNCLAGYNIIPDVETAGEIALASEPESISQGSTPMAQKKPKREIKLSDNSLRLKRQIESNVMISDNHYSQHYLNLRRRRENNVDAPERASASISYNSNTDVAQSAISGLEIGENAMELPETTHNAYKYPTDFRDIAGPSTAHYNMQFLDKDPINPDVESDSNNSGSLENTVAINLGREFLSQLDELFGRKDFLYPGYIQPMVNLPMSILQQINAHWAMSVAAQLDDGSTQSEVMIKQDEDFARELADKEQKMSEEGKEPEVPSLKEIMDMELAYSFYERSISEWRNNEPQDLAAKLSREKLYNLFPDISKEVLSEMLMAHEYNFKETIECLLISTGQSSWLEDEKGIEKFVMEKETERKNVFLEEQKKTLDEAEWPYLTATPDKPITLGTVDYYRDEAERFLRCRNINFDKARYYLGRKVYMAAAFHSEIAAAHTKSYEKCSGLAAAYLINYHQINNPDKNLLDLHYLRVREAMVSVDLFLDRAIYNLRSNNINFKNVWIITGRGRHSRGGPKIKPATLARLQSRGIMSNEINEGLLIAGIRSSHKMTSELSENIS